MTNRLYLDYAATTPVREEVLAAMLPFFSQSGYNASSVHAEGRAAKAALDDARERVARVLHCRPKEVVFTGGGSEADTLAILGTARASVNDRKALVSLPTEHHAVLHALAAAADEGFETRFVPVDRDGLALPDALAAAIDERTLLVSVMLANNELGVLQPVKTIAQLAHRSGALFHTDAVQAGQYLDLDVRELEADLVSLAAHKFYGPKGTGVLYVREGIAVKPLIHGGSQEFGKRAGTENVAAAVGLATALELAAAERTEAADRVRSVRDAFEQRVLARIPDVRVN
ncbi:MAG TPA: cysteine desulfurase family protein, partial [Candidatus Baltobacteraceae bacterium]|nr:cysteine desulfurase family protein [Candidatus Baltobacteraceae bacterium]